MAKSKELTKKNGSADTNSIVPFSEVPDYLPDTIKNSGLEALGKDDFKMPRIVLTQGLSPELENFPDLAKKDQYWHQGMNVCLGKEFDCVPVLAHKRVILFRPRNDQGGGILAFSKNGKTWESGANTEFTVKLKGKKDAVKWHTRKDVISSRLTEFGTADPDGETKAPAATTFYEYLLYLPKHPELSPCVLGLSKTGLPNGKAFNTSLAMIARGGKPIYCLGARAFTEDQNNEDGNWTVPNFQLTGYVSKDIFAITQKIAEEYSDYQLEYRQDDMGTAIKDEIQY